MRAAYSIRMGARRSVRQAFRERELERDRRAEPEPESSWECELEQSPAVLPRRLWNTHTAPHGVRCVFVERWGGRSLPCTDHLSDLHDRIEACSVPTFRDELAAYGNP